MRKALYTSASALILPTILSSCSSDTDNSSAPIAAIIFVILFIGASICSAAVTYKLKTKKSFQNKNNNDTEDDMENNNGS